MTDHIEAVAEAIKKELQITRPNQVVTFADIARVAIETYQQAVASEAVAWRWKYKNSVDWVDITPKEPNPYSFASMPVIEPLFAAPPAPQQKVQPTRGYDAFRDAVLEEAAKKAETALIHGSLVRPGVAMAIRGMKSASPPDGIVTPMEQAWRDGFLDGERHALESAPAIPAGWTFSNGELVRKKSGSWWEGKVVGFYSTKQTPEGYCVQLTGPQDRYQDRGPVQIYPLSALEAAPTPEKENE